MDERQLRKLAKKRADFKRHLFTYVVIIGFLAAINLLTSREYLWFLWPALGWGIGIAFHAFSTYSGWKESLEEREYEKLKERHSKKEE